MIPHRNPDAISFRQHDPALQSGCDFIPRADDIYIVTYPRSGTTWIQMILYQLTTDGNMDFIHISQCIPWLERAFLTGRNLNEIPSPRIFKTHWHLSRVRQWPGRYIYVSRDGRDVAVSYFHFYKAYLGFEGTFAEFFEMFLQGTVQYGTWFRHLDDAKKYKACASTMILRYEDLKSDLDQCIKTIAAFCCFDLKENFKEIVDRCTFEFMRRYELKFDHATEIWWERTRQDGRFLRQGKVGDWVNHFTPEQQLAFEAAIAALY